MATHKKNWSSTFVVNYGVNYSHRTMNACLFDTYKEAVAFYNKIDRKTFPCGEIVRIDYKFSYHGDFDKTVVKKSYDLDNNIFVNDTV